jgi:DNA-directed RNA polymerase specialized sigma24 family protein
MLYFLGMDDPRLAAALLASSPDALAGLFDAYGDRLFRYCWSMLRSREQAQVALRDTLLVAQAHIARLADPEDPESLGPWLYSLARAECRRHQAVLPAGADESPARLDLPVGDARLMSWNAAMSLEADEFEALDLACRHYVDLGQVLGLPAAAAEDLLDRARQHLERALGAEILTRRGPACPARDAMLAGTVLAGTGPDGQPGLVTAEVRERVLEHADGCAACGPEVPRNVSATRIFALLPAPALTPQNRTEILAALAGHVPPSAPALAQAALVPAPAVSAPASAAPASAAPASAAAAPGRGPSDSAASAPAQPAAALTSAAPTAAAAAARASGRSALGPSLASYVRVPEMPGRAAETSGPVPAGASSPSITGIPGASLAWNSSPSHAGTSGPSLPGSGQPGAPFAPAAAPSVMAASSSHPGSPAAAASAAPAGSPVPVAAPTLAATPARFGRTAPASSGPGTKKETLRPRRVHRGRLVIAGAGVLVSGVVIASAIAMAGPGKTASNGVGTPTLAARAASGPAVQASGLGAAGPALSRTPAETGTDRPAGTRLSTPPPLVNTSGNKNQVMITTATQPLTPDQAPGAQPDGDGPAAGGTTAVPGTLQLSAGGVILGDGNTGQITLTAADGTVSWSASANPPDQVSLSSSGSTLQNGQSITLTVQVSRGASAGTAAISFQVPGSDTQVIPVTWSAQPGGSGSGSGSGSGWHHHPSPPGPSPSSGTMSGNSPADPSSLGPASWGQSRRHDPARSRAGRP